MKILLMSTCTHALNDREFVLPISDILGENNHDIMHFEDCTEQVLFRYNKIIICGTSMQDFTYVGRLPFFNDLLKNFNKPILGICSGMHILSSIFGISGLIENTEVGLIEVNTLIPNKLFDGKFQAYNLHNYSVQDCDKFTILAISEHSIQAVKHVDKEIYGISFHPEVRNEKVISNFLKL
tara:strand:- start:97 stop:639 length:543 start_codon:yes stop_codon:yes gene_type:complete